jgi:AAA domain
MTTARDNPFAEVRREAAEKIDAGLPFRTLAELIEHRKGAAPDRWIVEHYVARGAKTLLSSQPKVGKSTTTFGMAKALRSGQEFAGLETAPNVGVLYLTEETSIRAIEVKAAAVDLNVSDPGLLIVQRVEVFDKPWPEVVELLRARAAAFKEAGSFSDVLAIVDTLGKWAGFKEGQEQDSGATREAIERLDPLAGDGHAVLINTHAGWSAKRSRGSSAIPGEVDIVLYLDGEPGSTQPRSILYEGGRLDDGETPRSWSLSLGDNGLTSFGEAGSRRAVRLAHVMDVVQREVVITSARLAEIIDVTDRTARRYLNQLVASGELLRQDEIGGPAGGRMTTYRPADEHRTDSPIERSDKEPVQNPVRPVEGSDLGFPVEPVPPIANGQHIETPLSVRPGERTEDRAPPENDCVRCQRYGPDHVGRHRSTWPAIEEPAGA